MPLRRNIVGIFHRQPAGVTQGRTLHVHPERQLQTLWCWAAVTSCIARYYDTASTWRQWSIVNAELGRSDCSDRGSEAGCNQRRKLELALDRTGNFERFEGYDAVVIRNELAAGRPLGARIQWRGRKRLGHFVVIHGAQGSWLDYLRVADPASGESSLVAESEFERRYRHQGSCTHLYLTKR